MSEYFCIHESDFGIIFTKIDNMSKSFNDQKIAVDTLLKYMYSKEAINDSNKKKSELTWKKVGIIISGILGISAILSSLILKLI